MLYLSLDASLSAILVVHMRTGSALSGIILSVIIELVSYVTEYWITDHVCTFGQLLFIGPANSHTHTLPVHCCINGLS